MIPLYTEKEFQTARSTLDSLPLKCKYCENTFYKLKHEIQKILAGHKYMTGDFCSEKCRGKNKTLSLTMQVNCKFCSTIFSKHLNAIKKTKNNFCTKSCAAKYNNTHKVKGIRRSKLEIWLESQLLVIYPDLHFDFNKTNAIEAELDIYIPSLKLAFELNGIFHYEPIYGSDKLESVKNNDQRKFQACLEKQIELCIIDTSSQIYFKPQNSQKFLDIIISIITSKIQGDVGYSKSCNLESQSSA